MTKLSLWLLPALAFAAAAQTPSSSAMGGVGDEHDFSTNPALYQETLLLKGTIEKMVRKYNRHHYRFKKFEPWSYRQQAVAGTNFLEKIKVTVTDQCLHVWIFKGFDGVYTVESVDHGNLYPCLEPFTVLPPPE